MADSLNQNLSALRTSRSLRGRPDSCVHPAWSRLMEFCAKLGHGEIERLKIQDGLPMIAEVTTRKIKFGP